MIKKGYREMVAAIILSVCMSMGTAPVNGLAAQAGHTEAPDLENGGGSGSSKDSEKETFGTGVRNIENDDTINEGGSGITDSADSGTGGNAGNGKVGNGGGTGNSSGAGDSGTGGETGDGGNSGETGDSGEAGDSGNSGETGDSGNSGETGDGGNSGETGDGGNSGGTGDGGNSGESGDRGNSGGPGDSGNSGEAGDSGNSGGTGDSGDSGEAGDGGNSGEAGDSGNSGGTGDSGEAGDGGNSGGTGDSGEAGDGGNSGTSGETGDSGIGDGSGTDTGEDTGNTGGAQDGQTSEEDKDVQGGQPAAPENPDKIDSEIKKPAIPEDFKTTDGMTAIYKQIDKLYSLYDIAGDDEVVCGFLGQLYNEIFDEYEALSDVEKEAFDTGYQELKDAMEMSFFMSDSLMLNSISAYDLSTDNVELSIPGFQSQPTSFEGALYILEKLESGLSGTASIKLTDDVTYGEAIEWGYPNLDLLLDLNGYDLEAASGLTLADSGISIKGDGGFKGKLTAGNKASLTADGCKLDGSVYADGASLSIKDSDIIGNINLNNHSSASLSLGNSRGMTGGVIAENQSYLTIASGSYHDMYIESASKVIIKGGEFSEIVNVYDGSTLVIDNGSFTGVDNNGQGGAALYAAEGSKVTLNGGTFKPADGCDHAIRFVNTEREIDQLWGDGKEFNSLKFELVSSADNMYGTVVDEATADNPDKLLKVVPATTPAIRDTVTTHMVEKVFGKGQADFDISTNTIRLNNNIFLNRTILVETDITIDLNDFCVQSQYASSDNTPTFSLNKDNVELTLMTSSPRYDDVIYDDYGSRYADNTVLGSYGYPTSSLRGNGSPAVGSVDGRSGTKVIVGEGVMLIGGDGYSWSSYTTSNGAGGMGAAAIVNVDTVELDGILIGGNGGRAGGNGHAGDGGNAIYNCRSVTALSHGKAYGGEGGNVPADGTGLPGQGGSADPDSQFSGIKSEDGRNGYHLTETVDAADTGVNVRLWGKEVLGRAVFEESDLDSGSRVYADLVVKRNRDAEDQEAVKAWLSANPSELVLGAIYDMELTKVIDTDSTHSTKEFSQANHKFQVSLELPSNMRGGTDVQVLCIRDGSVSPVEMSSTSSQTEIYFWVDYLSAYGIVYKPGTSGGGFPSGGGSAGGGGGGGRSVSGMRASRSMGQWIKDEKGWWYKNGTGSYPQDQWAYLNYNGTYNWYRFNKEGYLVTGWFTDAGDNTYYLHPVSDGTMGYMYTGWHQIDGKWYCFNTETDAGQGALLKGTVTPDGYSVDEAGIWIQ